MELSKLKHLSNYKNMPNWNEIIQEIQAAQNNWDSNPFDTIRRKYLLQVANETWRNVIAYYSGWLQKK